jgi:hypothetical protein
MIESREQFGAAMAWADRLRASIAELQTAAPLPGVHAGLRQALLDAQITQLQDLLDEVAEYEEREHSMSAANGETAGRDRQHPARA